MSKGTGYEPMELTIRRHMLAQLTDWAMMAVPNSSSLAVNGCLRVTVTEGRLTLASADQTRAVFVTTPAVNAQIPGEAFVPARKLKALLAEAPEGDVALAVKGSFATVTAGSASWQLRLPAPDTHFGFPDLAGAEFARVRRDTLHNALSTVRHAMGREASRAAFTQVRVMEADGLMAAWAADSSQLARCPVKDFPVELTIPGAVLDDLLKLLGKCPDDDIEVADTESRVVFRIGAVTVAALKSTHQFPDVAKAMAQVSGNSLPLVVDKGELTRAIRRVRVSADSSTSAVVLVAEGRKLTVSAKDKDGNAAEETVPLAEEFGERILLVANAEFLTALLSVHPPATCEFKVARERGKVRPPLLLADPESGVMGYCPQLTLKLAEF